MRLRITWLKMLRSVNHLLIKIKDDLELLQLFLAFSIKHGLAKAKALMSSISKARNYRVWDAWSLDNQSVTWAIETILDQKIERVIEFGAGYSTIILSEFIKQTGLSVSIHSFEHQTQFANRLRFFIPKNGKTQLVLTELNYLSDENFERLFENSAKCMFFLKNSSPLDKSLYAQTRIKNTFYNFDFQEFRSDAKTLVILDGPNGNGRSILFAILCEVAIQPTWILIDDYVDYPFLSYLGKIFDYKIEREFSDYQKQYVLVNLIKQKHADPLF